MPASRPRPQHIAVPATPKVRTRVGTWLRRHPARVRQAAGGSIAAGVVLFVVAAVTTTTATAVSQVAARPAVPRSSAADPASPANAHPAVPLSTRPSGQAKRGADRPRTIAARHRRKAPATPKVISGLAANGIPNVALNAYRVAAARMANADPSCGIDWALLAGIGREESDHGRFAGAVLHADGTSTPRIIGPALDGARWDYIPAPADGAQLDGDPTYAHALGPMQFIPQTWASYGVDANGDGIADVFNINDAALGAARYLCAAGGDLRTRAGQVAGILAYNHSSQYLAQVLALAEAYRTGIPITGVPVGRITGSLPPLDRHPTLPVNPGGPTANDPTRHTGGTHRSTSPGSPSGSRSRTSGGGHSGTRTRSGGSGGPTGSSTGGTRTQSSDPTSPAPIRHSSSHAPKPTGSRTPSPTADPTPTPTPDPTPSKTCKLSVAGHCLVP